MLPVNQDVMKSDAKLSAMPNIGAVVAALLIQAGIESPEQLRDLGAENTFIRLRAIDPGACINMLYGIEGAIQGIRWHDLDRGRKQELKEFFVSLGKCSR